MQACIIRWTCIYVRYLPTIYSTYKLTAAPGVTNDMTGYCRVKSESSYNRVSYLVFLYYLLILEDFLLSNLYRTVPGGGDIDTYIGTYTVPDVPSS